MASDRIEIKWNDQTVGRLHQRTLVNCGGIHCYRLMHPYSYACCSSCSEARQQGAATTGHTERCEQNHGSRTQ